MCVYFCVVHGGGAAFCPVLCRRGVIIEFPSMTRESCLDIVQAFSEQPVLGAGSVA